MNDINPSNSPFIQMFPSVKPDARDGSMAQLSAALAAINARLLAESQQQERSSQSTPSQ